MAVASEIEKSHKIGQPVLIGTTSIEKSEMISKILKIKKLNIKFLTQNIIKKKQKLSLKQVLHMQLLLTNMAGRSDIQLGGTLNAIKNELSSKNDQENENLVKKIKEVALKDKEKVIVSGGLFVLATERHESRRIDNQLRGRSGRQGDQENNVFLSLEDDLMRIFGSEKLDSMLSKLGMKEVKVSLILG